MGNVAGLSQLLNVRQVAETLAVSVRQVWKLVSLGELPVIRVGRCTRFDQRDVQAWIEQQKGVRR
jgi:excisionase family DNA binding protein